MRIAGILIIVVMLAGCTGLKERLTPTRPLLKQPANTEEALSIARDIARHHHERWDGSGYPDGLAGEQIPLCARIVALADVYDALTTQRPYKEPWSDERAAELIRRERGRHFDPHAVDAFLARADERRATRLAHPDEIEPADDVFAA